MGGTQLSSWMHDVLKIEVVFPMLAYDPAKLICAGKGFWELQTFLIFRMSFQFKSNLSFFQMTDGTMIPLSSGT